MIVPKQNAPVDLSGPLSVVTQLNVLQEQKKLYYIRFSIKHYRYVFPQGIILAICFSPGKLLVAICGVIRRFSFHTSELSVCLTMMTSSSGNILRVTVFCAGNSPVTDEFPAQRPVTLSFDVFDDLRLNKRLSKQSWSWWFETPSRSLWRHCNVNPITTWNNQNDIIAQRQLINWHQQKLWNLP